MVESTSKTHDHRHLITAELVAQSLADISDAKLAAIVDTGATVTEFEEALEQANDQNAVMGELERSLSGAAAAVYDILTTEEQFPEREP